MKLSIFFVFALVAMSTNAQVSRNTTPRKVKSVSVNKADQPKTVTTTTTTSSSSKVYTAEELTKKIHAFQVKIDYINADETRKQQATSDGSLKKLEDRKKAYEQQLIQLTTNKQ